jgi:DNA-directed RNA polymerase omega subunit
MIYNNLEKIYETSHIENKYALAMVVSTRARQLSEQKGRSFEGEGSERYITHAIDEIAKSRLNIDPAVMAEARDDASSMGA